MAQRHYIHQLETLKHRELQLEQSLKVMIEEVWRHAHSLAECPRCGGEDVNTPFVSRTKEFDSNLASMERTLYKNMEPHGRAYIHYTDCDLATAVKLLATDRT